MHLVFVIFLAHVIIISACPEPLTTVLIQNHDGPIYVSPESCSCEHHTNIGNRSPNCNHSCNRSPCNRDHSTTYSPTDNPLLHNYPHHSVYDTDCKCVTKQLSTCVPINTVPQNTCTGTYYASSYPDYYYAYPDGQGYGSHGSSYGSAGSSYGTAGSSFGSAGSSFGSAGSSYGSAGSSYGSGGSDYGSVGSCPIASEGFIPLLKTYLVQGKCPKHGCQCGQNYSSC